MAAVGRRSPGRAGSGTPEHQVLPVGASVEHAAPGPARRTGVVAAVRPPPSPGGPPSYDVAYDAGGPPGLSLPARLVRPAAPPPGLLDPPRDVLGAGLVPRSFRSGQRDVMSGEEYAALTNHAGLFRVAHSDPG